ncbi:Reverse transcriptase domain-containing protein, partial [Aphis craccivora]
NRKNYEFDKDINFLFIDFKSPYNSINRNKLWSVMCDLGIPEKLMRLIRACIQGSKCKVKFRNTISEEF